jgi:hypothetical protein
VDSDQNGALLRTRPWAPAAEDESVLAQGQASDPAISKLHEQQKEFNARVHEELEAIPVPTTLRDQILARRKIVTVPRWRSAQPLLAIAAALVILGVGLFYWMPSREDTSLAGFRSRMVGFAVREYRMDVFTNDFTEVKHFLAQQKKPADFSLPPGLAKLPLKGGAAMNWQGKPVSMVCFASAAKTTLYMFVLNEPLSSSSVRPEAVKGLNTVTWSTDGKTFLLAGRVPEASLAELVKS